MTPDANATPPKPTSGAATMLEYAVTPSQIVAGSQQSLTLTATNPANGSRIEFTPGPQGDEIVLIIPAPPGQTGANALTDKVDFAARSESDGFIAGAQPGESNSFVIRPLGQAVLQPGQAITVRLGPVTVNSDPGQASLTIEEYIGTNSATATVELTKSKQPLQITAWLGRQIAGKGEAVTLYWQSAGGTVVDIAGLDGGDGTRSFPVQGKTPPYPGQISFMPAATGSMVLTLTVRTGDGQHTASVPVTLTVRAPDLVRFTSTPASGVTLPVDRPVTLDWNVLYARAVSLTTPSGAGPQLVPAQPLRQMQRVPGDDALRGAVTVSDIPATVDYILTATGYAPQAQTRLSFALAPVSFQYFKYLQRDAAGKLSGLSFGLNPQSWTAYQMVMGELNTFTLYQPGGGLETYYIGPSDSTHPQILYFDTTAAPSGGKVTVAWQTANLTSLVLDPGGIAIPAADIAKGSLEVALPADNLVVLTGTAANGETIPSVLSVAPETG